MFDTNMPFINAANFAAHVEVLMPHLVPVAVTGGIGTHEPLAITYGTSDCQTRTPPPSIAHMAFRYGKVPEQLLPVSEYRSRPRHAHREGRSLGYALHKMGILSCDTNAACAEIAHVMKEEGCLGDMESWDDRIAARISDEEWNPKDPFSTLQMGLFIMCFSLPDRRIKVDRFLEDAANMFEESDNYALAAISYELLVETYEDIVSNGTVTSVEKKDLQQAATVLRALIGKLWLKSLDFSPEHFGDQIFRGLFNIFYNGDTITKFKLLQRSVNFYIAGRRPLMAADDHLRITHLLAKKEATHDEWNTVQSHLDETRKIWRMEGGLKTDDFDKLDQLYHAATRIVRRG